MSSTATTTASTKNSKATQSKISNSSFTLIKTEKIDSLNIELEIYQHKITGAMHYHLSADNNENVFLVLEINKVEELKNMILDGLNDSNPTESLYINIKNSWLWQYLFIYMALAVC